MLVGQKIGPFEIDRELGSGAMGDVYRAIYTKTGQRVALKVISPGLCANDTALARFEREMAVLKQLNHPNIVRLYATGRYHKTPFYAMEYIEGESLDHVLERRGRFTWEEVVELGQQLCAALQHAHEHGIVHRDLKPSNVMILRDGKVKLTDFGIAKDLDVTGLTSAHCTVGTASYMSPEQCRGERNLTHKSDLYSMGVLFYELVVGQKPFKAETTMDMFLLHTQGEFERPSRRVLDIPVWLDTLICQLLEKKPEHRPFDAATVSLALNRVVEKVSAQQSAGVDAAKARVIDRTRHQPKLDETDKAAAKTLLTSLGKGKRKRKRQPFYEKGWFVSLAVAFVLIAFGGMLYLIFRPASPTKLYQEAQKLMASGDPDQQDKAREGPIKAFLKNYPDQNDEQARQMRAWADEMDLALRERQFSKRLSLNLPPENDAEQAAVNAVRREETGDLAAVQDLWAKVEKYKGDADPDLHAWGLLADKRLRELREMAAREQQLAQKTEHIRLVDPQYKPETPAEQQAIEAERYRTFGDLPMARDRWQKIKDQYDKSPDQRLWFLLAAKRVKDLNDKAPPQAKEKEQQQREALIQLRLDEAQKWLQANQPQPAFLLVQEIVVLYASAGPELEAKVAQAKKQLEVLLPKP